MTLRQRFGLILMIGAALGPALILKDHLKTMTLLQVAMAVAVSLLAGAGGGALLGEACPKAGAIAGALAGPSGVIALYFFAHSTSRRDRKLEEMAIMALSSLPAFGLYFLLKRIMTRPGSRAPRP